MFVPNLRVVCKEFGQRTIDFCASDGETPYGIDDNRYIDVVLRSHCVGFIK